MYRIKVTKEFGRGLYANRDIYANELIEVCELLILSPEDTIKVNQTDLKYYTFVFNSNQDCLVLGNGEIFNHNDNPNIEYCLVKYGNRMKMCFRSVKDIKEDEQLFINYNADQKVNTEKYNKNLMG